MSDSPRIGRPDVSVIIPTYNRAQLLERCLQSLHRAMPAGLEVIVVDDGGADESEAVCARFANTSYLRQENAGPATARNLGFTASHGRFVAFIDSDDEWISGGPTRLVRQLDANVDVGVIFADTLMGNPHAGFASFIGTYGEGRFESLPYESRDDGVRVLRRTPFLVRLSSRNVMFLASMLFRREAFEALNGFAPYLRGAADWDLFMRSVVKTTVAFSEGEPLSLYYKHDEGMAMDSGHMQSDFVKALANVLHQSGLSADEARHIDECLRGQAFGWAFEAYDRGDLMTARERLTTVFALGGRDARQTMLWGLTYLPGPAVRTMRRLKHAVLG